MTNGIVNSGETHETGQELSELLQKAVERQESLHMPKPKEHWKQRRLRRSKANKKIAARECTLRARKRYEATLRAKYLHLKRQIAKQSPDWELELSDWYWAWTMARPALRGGIPVPALMATGRKWGDVKFMRKDKSLPYRKDNIQIIQGDEVLFP